MRESNRQDLLDDALEDWKLLLRCHVGRQDLRLGTRVGQRRGLDTELGWWRVEVVCVVVLGDLQVPVEVGGSKLRRRVALGADHFESCRPSLSSTSRKLEIIFSNNG